MRPIQSRYRYNEIVCIHRGWVVRYLPGCRGPASRYAVCDPYGTVVASFVDRFGACDKAYEWAYRMAFQGEQRDDATRDD